MSYEKVAAWIVIITCIESFLYFLASTLHEIDPQRKPRTIESMLMANFILAAIAAFTWALFVVIG